MDNNQLFKALSSKTRIKMINLLIRKENHVSGLARQLGISVPVASKHIKILEKTGLVHKRKIGNVHLLSAKIKGLEHLLEEFAEKSTIRIHNQDTLLDALKQIPGIEAKEIHGKKCITSVDGDEGYYIYEVDGKLPEKSIDEYKPQKNIKVSLKKIISVDKKKIDIKLK